MTSTPIQAALLAKLEALQRAPTAPFREEWALAALDGMLADIPGLEREEDRFGNRIVRLRRGRPAGARAAVGTMVPTFVAHVDHPGFLFPEQGAADREDAPSLEYGEFGPRAGLLRDGEAFLYDALFEGRVEDGFFVDAPVRLYRSADDPGVAGRVAGCSALRPHTDDRVAVIATRDPAEGARLAMWDVAPFAYMAGDGLIRARACDDLAGVAALVEALARLGDESDADVKAAGGIDLCVVFTRAEEAGFCGALALMNEPELPSLVPDDTIFVSVEISSERPGVEVGGGAVVRVGDRASTFDGAFADALWSVARARGARARRALMDGGTCEATAFARAGRRCGGVCAPVRHYHNMDRTTGRIGPEAVSLGDVEALVDLIAGIARGPAAAPPAVTLDFEMFLRKGRELLAAPAEAVRS